jgi:hypothetical protein
MRTKFIIFFIKYNMGSKNAAFYANHRKKVLRHKKFF